MSRLDDELRNAFRRAQPSADFTSRVLERIAQQPERRPSWWRRLAMLFEPPKLRWVAIGVTASLLLAIGAAQYGRLRQVPVDDGAKVAAVPPDAAPNSGKQEQKPTVQEKGEDLRDKVTKPAPRISHRAPSTNHRVALPERQKQEEVRAEAEAAKDKLMLALQIASVALNDVQKAVHDDSPKP